MSRLRFAAKIKALSSFSIESSDKGRGGVPSDVARVMDTFSSVVLKLGMMIAALLVFVASIAKCFYGMEARDPWQVGCEDNSRRVDDMLLRSSVLNAGIFFRIFTGKELHSTPYSQPAFFHFFHL